LGGGARLFLRILVVRRGGRVFRALRRVFCFWPSRRPAFPVKRRGGGRGGLLLTGALKPSPPLREQISLAHSVWLGPALSGGSRLAGYTLFQREPRVGPLEVSSGGAGPLCRPEVSRGGFLFRDVFRGRFGAHQEHGPPSRPGAPGRRPSAAWDRPEALVLR